jgi:hypothetical protein
VKYVWNEEIVFKIFKAQNKSYFQIKFIFFTIEGLTFVIINYRFEIE